MNRYCIRKGTKKLPISVLLILIVILFMFFIGSISLILDREDADTLASAYTVEGIAITNESQFAALRSSSTTAYLANDITLTNIGYNSSTQNGTPYSGTLNGNGKTITINMAYTLGGITDSSTHYLGLMFAFLQGTVRDCNIVLTNNISFYESSGSDNNFLTILGIICGRLQGGTITNVNVIVNGALNFIGRDTGGSTDNGGTGTLVGAFAGCTSGGTISNCNLINNNCIFGATEDDDGNDDEGTATRICVGGFVGEVEANATLNMSNIGINGAAGSIIGAQVNYNTSGNGHDSARAGGIIGAVRSGATVNITGLDFKYKGYIVTAASNSAYGNYIIGRMWNSTAVRVSDVVFSNYVYPGIIRTNSKLTRQSMISPMNFNNGLAFNCLWPYTSGFSANMIHTHQMGYETITERLVSGNTGGWSFTNYRYDDGSVDFIIYNNTSESANYTVLDYSGNSNPYHNVDTLRSYFSGLEGSLSYTWNSYGFNVRLQMGLGTASPLNMFSSNFDFYGNGYNKTLYITGNAKGSGIFLFNLGSSYLAPIIEFNVNAYSTAFPIIDQSTTAGGSVKITGGTYEGNWTTPGIGVVHMAGAASLTVTGGTIINTGAGEAIFSSNSAINISGGTFSSAVNLINNTATIANTGAGGVTVSGGNITNTGVGRAVVSYGGPVTISGNTQITSSPADNYGTVCNYSAYDTVISGGTITNNSSNGCAIATYDSKVILSGSASIISNSTYPTFVIHNTDLTNSSKVIFQMNGGTLKNNSSNGIALANWGKGTINISGGTLECSTDVAAITVNNTFIMNISGGTLKNSLNGSLIALSDNFGGQINVSGGSLTSGGNVINAYYGTNAVTISGGSLSSSNASAVFANSGNVTIRQDSGKTTTLSSASPYAASGTVIMTSGGSGNFSFTGGTITNTSSGNGVYLSGSGAATFSGGTVTANGGKAINADGSGTISISAGTYNAAYSVFYASSLSSFTLSSAPSLNGTTADIYAGKVITASGITGGAYTLYWAGGTSNGTTVVSGSSDTSKFSLTNGGYGLYGSGNNILLGKISAITYYGVTSTSGLVTSYIESFGTTLAAPSSSNIASGLTYAGMYTASDFATTISSIPYSRTGGVSVFVKKTLNYSINATATSITYGDGSITLSASTSADTSKVTYAWRKNSAAYSSSASVVLSLADDSGTYGLTMVYSETFGSYTLVSNGTTSDIPITINKRQLTISGVDALDRVFNNTSTVSLTGGRLVNYKDGDGYSGNSLLGFNLGSGAISSSVPGTYTVSGINITLTGSKAANYQLTQPSGINVIISAKSLATDLHIGTVDNVTYSGSAFLPKPSLTDSIQTLVENRDFTFSYLNNTNAGIATITVTGAGNYTGSNSVTFIINPKDLSSGIAAGTIGSFYYSGNAYTPTPSLSYTQFSLILTAGTPSSGDFWFTYSNNIDAGTAAVTANGRVNYSGTLTLSFTIRKADVTISVNGLSSLVYGQTLASSAISGTAVNKQYNSVTVSGNWSFVLPIATQPDVGNTAYTISFMPAMSGNYNTPANVSANLTVSKCIPTLSNVSASSVEYKREISTSALSGIAKNNYSNTIVAGTFGFSEPSTIASNGAAYQVIFYPNDLTRYLTTAVSVTVYVVPRLLTVTNFDAVNRAYNASAAITAFTYTLNNIYGFESVGIEAIGTISNANASATPYTVQIISFVLTGTHKDNYYINDYSGTVDIIISPLTIAVSADNYSKTYGDPDPVFDKVIDSTTADGNLTIRFGRDLSGNDKQNAGVYNFNSVNLVTPNSNYNIVFAADGGKNKFTINQYALKVTAKAFSKIYGDADPLFNEDFVCAYDETVNVTYIREAGNNAGAYSFTAVNLTSPNSNYTVNFSPNGGKDKFVISPYAFTIIANSCSKIYGEADPAFTQDFICAYGETVNVTYTREIGSNAGTYSFIAVNLTSSNPNYTVSFGPNGGKDKFVISPYVLTVAARNFSKTYGDDDPLFTEDFVCAYGETVNVTYTREEGNNAGTYSFNAITLTSLNTNYIVNFAANGGKDKFIISPFALTVTARNFSKTYGEEDPILTEDFLGAYGQIINVTYTRETGKNAGTYSFAAIRLTSPNYNYTVSFAANGGKDKLIINPYSLTVTANAFSKVYGNADPSFTQNFVCAYNETIKVTYTRETGNNVGTYSFISVKLTSANSNYIVSFQENGGKDKFVISPYALKVTARIFNKIYGGEDPSFTESFVCAYGETVNVTYTREEGNNAGTYSFAALALTSPDANYTVSFAANGGKDKFVISPYVLTVTAQDFSKTYGEDDPTFTEDFICAYGETVNVTYTREIGKNVGSYSFTAVALTAYNPNYTVNFASNGGKDKFVISPYVLTVTAQSFNKIYGEANPSFTEDFVCAYGETVNVTYIREIGNDAGVYSFIALALTSPDANYTINFAEDGGKDKFVISQYILTVNARNFNKTYGEEDPTLTEDFVGGYGETVTITYVREIGENAGSYSFINLICTQNNYLVSFAPNGKNNKFVIVPKEIILVWGNLDLVYNGRYQLPALLIDPSSLIGSDSCFVEINGAAKDVGEAYIAKVVSISNENYAIPSQNSVTYSIAPYTVEVSIPQFYKVYGEQDLLVYTIAAGIEEESITICYVRTIGENAAAYDIIAIEFFISNPNYTLTTSDSGDSKFVIEPKEVTLIWGETHFVYNGQYQAPTISIDNLSIIDGDICEIGIIGAQIVASATEYTAEAVIYNSNYKLPANHTKNFTIIPYSLEIISNGFIKAYGEDEPNFIETFIGVNGEQVAVRYTRDTSAEDYQAIGKYDLISVETYPYNSNYVVYFGTEGGKAKYEIKAYSLFVEPIIFNKVYGDMDPIFRQIITGKMGEQIIVYFTRDTQSTGVQKAGSYNFIDLYSYDENYLLQFAEGANIGKFVITPFIIEANAKTFNKVYGDADPQFTEVFEGAYGESIEVTYFREAGENVGTYSFVSVSQTTENPNYNIYFAESGASEKFTIYPYNIYIEAKSFSKMYGDPDPALTEDCLGANGEIVNVTYIREMGENVDNYSLESVIQTEFNPNYSVSFAKEGGDDKFIVYPYRLVVSAMQYTKVYGEANPIFLQTFDGAFDETVSVTYILNEEAKAVGLYSFGGVVLTQDNLNYAVSFAQDGNTDKFMITPHILYADANIYYKNYGEEDPQFTQDLEGVYDEIINVTFTRDKTAEGIENVGLYSFDSVYQTAENPNYEVYFAQNGNKDKFVINKYILVVDAAVFSKVYGDTEPQLYEDFVCAFGEIVKVVYTRDISVPTNQNVGFYDLITIKLAVADNNYTVLFDENGGKEKFIIKPYDLYVAPLHYVKTYGEDDPIFAETFDGVNGERVDVTFSRDKTNLSCDNAGNYDLIYAAITDNNYRVFITEDGGKDKLQILPYKVKVVIDNKNSYFGHPLASLSWRMADDSALAIDDDDLNIMLTKEEGLEARTYIISGIAGNNNYDVEFINGVYTIVILPVEYTVYFYKQDANSEKYSEVNHLRAKFIGIDTVTVFYTPNDNLFKGFEVNLTKSILLLKLNSEAETQEMKVYYSRKKFKLNINVDGGNIKEDKNSFLYGNQVVLPIPVKEGYDFEGWYINGTLLTSNTFNYDSDVMIEARWKIKPVYIVFKGNGGAPVDRIELKYGDSLPESLSTSTKKGAEFQGWYQDEACTVPANLNGNAKENIVLYAKWQENKSDALMYLGIGIGVILLCVASIFLFKKKV